MIGLGTLHVILDETLQSRFSHVELARLAAQGGADVIQYREKRPRPEAERIATARAILEALSGYPARLVVNDRVDVARACGAWGVHLGRCDADPATARRLLGDAVVIGVTANDLDRALRVQERPVDYLGVGPVFGTTSKRDPAPALGLEGLARIAAASRRPVVAVGGITPQRVGAVLAAGAAGVAVLSEVVCRANPGEATRRFRRAIDECRKNRGGRDHARSGGRSV